MDTPPSRLGRAAFLECFGGTYEHSPWIAEGVYDAGLDHRHDAAEFLHDAFKRVILSAGRDAQLGLLRAHPPLAAGKREELTDASRSEQSGVGLDRCSPAEFAQFQKLNAAYRQRFGFPFIIAVKGRSRSEILAIFRARMGREPEVEFEEALEQVCLIGRHRLTAQMHD